MKFTANLVISLLTKTRVRVTLTHLDTLHHVREFLDELAANVDPSFQAALSPSIAAEVEETQEHQEDSSGWARVEKPQSGPRTGLALGIRGSQEASADYDGMSFEVSGHTWQVFFDDQGGGKYFYRPDTEETVWTDPRLPSTEPEDGQPTEVQDPIPAPPATPLPSTESPNTIEPTPDTTKSHKKRDKSLNRTKSSSSATKSANKRHKKRPKEKDAKESLELSGPSGFMKLTDTNQDTGEAKKTTRPPPSGPRPPPSGPRPPPSEPRPEGSQPSSGKVSRKRSQTANLDPETLAQQQQSKENYRELLAKKRASVSLKQGHPISELVAMQDGFSDKQKKKVQIINEIYKTEEDYLKDLNFLLTEYKKPMLVANLIDAKEASSIFGNVEVLIGLNQVLFADLAKNKGGNIGGSFSSLADYMKMYSSYCNNYNSADKVVKNLRKKTKFVDFLNDVKKRSRGLDLEDFMIKPIQRICKYPLLLRELISCEEDEEEADLIDTAMEKIADVVATINESKRDEDSLSKLVDLLGNLESWPYPDDPLLNNERKFLYDGAVFVLGIDNSVEDYNFYLFNNLLLQTTDPGRAKIIGKIAKVAQMKMKVVRLWRVTHLLARDVEDGTWGDEFHNCIEMCEYSDNYQLQAKMRFFVENTGSKQTWMTYLNSLSLEGLDRQVEAVLAQKNPAKVEEEKAPEPPPDKAGIARLQGTFGLKIKYFEIRAGLFNWGSGPADPKKESTDVRRLRIERDFQLKKANCIHIEDVYLGRTKHSYMILDTEEDLEGWMAALLDAGAKQIPPRDRSGRPVAPAKPTPTTPAQAAPAPSTPAPPTSPAKPSTPAPKQASRGSAIAPPPPSAARGSAVAPPPPSSQTPEPGRTADKEPAAAANPASPGSAEAKPKKALPKLPPVPKKPTSATQTPESPEPKAAPNPEPKSTTPSKGPPPKGNSKPADEDAKSFKSDEAAPAPEPKGPPPKGRPPSEPAAETKVPPPKGPGRPPSNELPASEAKAPPPKGPGRPPSNELPASEAKAPPPKGSGRPPSNEISAEPPKSSTKAPPPKGPGRTEPLEVPATDAKGPPPKGPPPKGPPPKAAGLSEPPKAAPPKGPPPKGKGREDLPPKAASSPKGPPPKGPGSKAPPPKGPGLSAPPSASSPSPAMPVCPSCNTVQPKSGAKFCTSCGGAMPVAETAACASCSTLLKPGAKFCAQCGTTAKAEGSPASSSVASSSALPAGWTQHKTDDGKAFYFNASTDETSWVLPVAQVGAWKLIRDGSEEYYYNEETGESSWSAPQ